MPSLSLNPMTDLAPGTYWLSGFFTGIAMSGVVLSRLTRSRFRDALEQPPWIKRRVYKDSPEFNAYIRQRLRDRTSSSFEWDGHRWRYEYTSFNDGGDYDMICRPPL